MPKHSLYNLLKQDEIIHQLEIFLRQPRLSQNGQPAPVSEHDLSNFQTLIEIIAEAKWQRDQSGNLPINWMVFDQAAYRRGADQRAD